MAVVVVVVKSCYKDLADPDPAICPLHAAWPVNIPWRHTTFLVSINPGSCQSSYFDLHMYIVYTSPSTSRDTGHCRLRLPNLPFISSLLCLPPYCRHSSAFLPELNYGNMSDRRRRKSLSVFRPALTGLTPIHYSKDQVACSHQHLPDDGELIIMTF